MIKKSFLLAMLIACFSLQFQCAFPSIKMPTIVHIEGLEPVNQGLDQISNVVDKINSVTLERINASINSITNVPHIIGIMALGMYFCYWGLSRFNNKESSDSWQKCVVNGFLACTGFLLTIAAPLIAARVRSIII